MPRVDAVRSVAATVAGTVLVSLPSVAPDTFSTWLLKLVDTAVDGGPGLPGAKQLAARHFQRRQQVGPAIDALTRLHVGLASAQGFVTNVGGALAAVVGIPANAVGIVVVQVRLAACIAHLHGYDIDDPRVRTALVMCLLGNKRLAAQFTSGDLPAAPLAVATAAVHDATLATQVAQRVIEDVLGDIGTKDLGRLAGQLVLRRIPVLGGGVGAVVDAYSTAQVARCARTQLVNRRPALEPEAH